MPNGSVPRLSTRLLVGHDESPNHDEQGEVAVYRAGERDPVKSRNEPNGTCMVRSYFINVAGSDGND